jgi:hypothetical protein
MLAAFVKTCDRPTPKAFPALKRYIRFPTPSWRGLLNRRLANGDPNIGLHCPVNQSNLTTFSACQHAYLSRGSDKSL